MSTRPKHPRPKPATLPPRYCDHLDRLCEHATPFGRCMFAGRCPHEAEHGGQSEACQDEGEA